MKKYHIVVFFLTLLSLILGCTADTKFLKITPKGIDFGEVFIGNSSSLDIVLQNKFGKDILITELKLDGSPDYLISQALNLPIDLEKNKEYTVTIQFDPSVIGQIDSVLKITNNASNKDVEVSITGIGVPVPRILLSETSFDFGKKLINRTHTHDFEIENVGTETLSISSLTLTGSAATVYKVTSSPISILAGAKETITVRFEPIVIGTYDVDLEIVHDAVNESTPLIYKIKGEGIFVDPRITINQSSPWDFGTVTNISPSTEFCDIENTGVDPLTISSVTLSTSVEFTIDSKKDSNGNDINFPRKITVGDKVTIGIKFLPTSDTMFYDTLSIEHDGTNESTPFDVSIEGTGMIVKLKTFNYTGSIEHWTVPAGVTTITIEAWGAEGGENITLKNQSGRGARMKGDFTVTPGETLSIVVGQRGYNATSGNAANGSGGGGGGSFVWRATANTYPMIAAGGGGASCLTNNGLPHYQGKDAVTTQAGTGSRSHDIYNDSPGGSNGSDGRTVTDSGGKGWISIKVNPAGGTGAYYGGNGGYGGGGANGLIGGDPSFWNHNAGGGGGYSGGGAGGTRFYFGGGGGGSYNSGSNQNNADKIQQGNGKVTITY